MQKIFSVVDTKLRFTKEQRDRFFTKMKTGQFVQPSAKLLNPELANLVLRLGHTDMLLVTDLGFPTFAQKNLLDISLMPGIPMIPDVLQAIEGHFTYDRIICVEEIKKAAPERYKWLKTKNTLLESLGCVEFKELAQSASACIRTGDATPFSNIILVCG